MVRCCAYILNAARMSPGASRWSFSAGFCPPRGMSGWRRGMRLRDLHHAEPLSWPKIVRSPAESVAEMLGGLDE